MKLKLFSNNELNNNQIIVKPERKWKLPMCHRRMHCQNQ